MYSNLTQNYENTYIEFPGIEKVNYWDSTKCPDPSRTDSHACHYKSDQLILKITSSIDKNLIVMSRVVIYYLLISGGLYW